MTVKTCFHDVIMCFEVLKSSVKEKMELVLVIRGLLTRGFHLEAFTRHLIDSFSKKIDILGYCHISHIRTIL